MKEMNQEAFTYDKHEMGWWTAFDLTFAESLDAAAIKRLVKKICNRLLRFKSD